MKTLKTIMMALSLAAAPAAVLAQAAAPAPVPAVTTPEAATTPVSPTAAATPGATSATPDAKEVAKANTAPAYAKIAPSADIGQPIEGGFKIQPQVTSVGEDAQWFHNVVLMPIITVICIFVLVLLIYVAFRYRAARNPIPSKTSHNTLIEIVWTLAPVLILLVIAVPSIQLLAKQYAPPKADLTVKVIGNQWYWTYQYPDNGDFELVSNMLKEGVRKPEDGPRLLAVDERMVVPVGAVVKLIVTSNDVIHSFAVPAFWTKMDAVPGRLNETGFKADRPGVYYGQCSELCGARHGFMPIAVDVVSREQFAAWVASKGGTMPGAAPVANPDATTPASPATAGPAAPAAPGLAAPAPAIPATGAAPATTSQAATANQGSQP
ncbi:cytochrome c oxidase subunit II [Sphingomonas solaris]|uniref:Cytochrome c oxidase subunit 2 n=1 Tax=Alterirhizorhabdus solaris TaxID=2529389 RepID=A0A558QVU5_9SPHN|nr:cytochrome c oxidase subunit II [Sphingomonas solaris]TVV71273.1 cytochrome c oxidase subunit II [Sphingomonas solaris]